MQALIVMILMTVIALAVKMRKKYEMKRQVNFYKISVMTSHSQSQDRIRQH